MNATEADQALGAYIQSLRLQAGLAPDVLARRMSLSQAQLLQLENGEHSLFYTRRIRQQAARKVILHLGGDPARASDDGQPEVTAPMSGPAFTPSLVPLPAAKAPAQEAGQAAVAAAVQPSRLRPGWVLAAAGLTGLSLVPLGVLLWPTEQATSLPVPALQSPSPVALAQASEMAAPVHPSADVARDQPVAELPAPPACPPGTGQLPTVQPQQASKPGNMVYVVSPVRQQVCLTDARGEVQVSQLEAGQGRSFYGQPPWQIHSPELQRLEMYFQGWRVRLPAQAQDTVQLVELR